MTTNNHNKKDTDVIEHANVNTKPSQRPDRPDGEGVSEVNQKRIVSEIMRGLKK